MLTFIYGLTSGGLLLLIFLILTNSRIGNLQGNRWLAFFLISLLFLIIDECLIGNNIFAEYPQLIGFESFFVFAIAPALYLTVSHYISVEKQFSKKEIIHFLPTMLLFPFIISTISQNIETKLELLKNIDKPTNPEDDLLLYFIWIQIFIYWIMSFLKIIKHQKNIKIFASSTQNIDLNWLKNFLLGIAIMFVLWVVETFLNTSFFSIISAVGYLVSTFFLGYFSLQQVEIYPFKETEKVEIKEIIEEIDSKIVVKSPRISEEELNDLKDKLRFLVETEKLYLDENLSLPKLAEKIKISSHNLSYLLNEGFGENFFQFINKYRVEEAKSLLISPKYEQLSMIGIAFESGFSSKTTFNTTFKKITGISPSEFIANHSTSVRA